MRRCVLLLLVITGALPALAADTIPPDRQRFCGLVRSCSLPEPAGWCAAVGATPRYEADRCAEAQRLVAGGVAPQSATGYRLYQFLGYRYQVVFATDGEVTLSPTRLAFLVEDLPLAAKLLTHFQKTRYTAEYLDAEHRRFKGARGDHLTTEAERILGSPASGRVEYLGFGVSQVGFWKLKGLALIQVDLAAARGGRAVAYKVRVVSSPANAVVNAVMKLPLFRLLVHKYIRDTLDDITEAAQRLERSGLDGPSTEWTPEERQKLTAFLALR